MYISFLCSLCPYLIHFHLNESRVIVSFSFLRLNGMKENGMQTQNSQINLHWCRIIDGKVKEKLDKSRDTRKMKVLLCN